MKPLKIAFLTSEFVGENSQVGGLATYVHRMAITLRNMGHRPEVFTLSNYNSGAIEFEGIRVERVKPTLSLHFRLVRRLMAWGPLRPIIYRSYILILAAHGIARAVAKREKKGRFHFIHSADTSYPGLFVRKSLQRPLIVRCSWARDLCVAADEYPNSFNVRFQGKLEDMLIRRADLVYAPSNFVADYYSEKYRRKVKTVRPSFVMDAATSCDLPNGLPKRFLFHFGRLGALKGTDVLAASLPIVWREDPSFTMVWAGHGHLWTKRGPRFTPELFRDFARKAWGDRASQVMWLGVLGKEQLYAVMQLAEASVLPSRYDNFPNTAIESLSLGIPVIGTRGASFEELIEPGFSGDLVPIDDPAALAESMLKVWRRQVSWTGIGFRRPAIFREMEPDIAASNLIRLSGISN